MWRCDVRVKDKILYRHNVHKINSIEEFYNKGVEVKSGYKDVYFVRLLGVDQEYTEKIKTMDEKVSSREIYIRVDKLIPSFDLDIINLYEEYYNKWITSNKERLIIKSSESNCELQEYLSRACREVINLYTTYKRNISESMIKNFMIKLMYWFDYLFGDKLTGWNNSTNVKVVLSNIFKEQEYLFCYMMTLSGIDVLLLQCEKDIQLNKELAQLSTTCVLGEFKTIDIPQYTRSNSTDRIRVVIPSRPHRRYSTQKKVKDQISYNDNQATMRVDAMKSDTRREKNFEELALLAASIVMIAVHNDQGEIIGTGSGIMIGREGYILTNYHVANKGAFYSVRIENDEVVYNTDELIKYNSILDLAIIRIYRILTPIPIYTSKKKLVRGQKVVAIGSPLGLFNSVSDGIISGFRVIKDVDMIQFTAPISQGSSGGAVLNMYGEVIGISTAGFDDGQNINLAVGYESINMFIKGFVN